MAGDVRGLVMELVLHTHWPLSEILSLITDDFLEYVRLARELTGAER
ncbi:MAG: hypothetical protein LBS77_07035 [Desulfovibrio sp.]|jgi:hypothetical protein|nr:hypothetical protein [Desulfovibrio sp.]